MDRKINVTPEQSHRIRELVYLAGGIDQLQLSELRLYKAWKDFFFQCLCEMEELGLLKSIRTYPTGMAPYPPDRRAARAPQPTPKKICPVIRLAAQIEENRPLYDADENLTERWRELFLEVIGEFVREGLLEVPARPGHGKYKCLNQDSRDSRDYQD